MNIGCHVSISKGIENSPLEAQEFGCETMQIFTRSPQGGTFSEISKETVLKFKDNCKKARIKNVHIHAPYFINFASANNRVYYSSINSIKTELERASLLGAKYVMTHLGSAKDLGEKEAVKKTIDGLKKIFEEYEGKTELLIENSAGSGQIIGSDFKQIGKILKSLQKAGSEAKIAGICLDTQHSFASGLDWKNDFKNSLKFIDKSIGVENIRLMHANDSLTDLNSHIDRHSHIGKGKIGIDGFRNLINFAKENDIDMIVETNYPGVVKDIEILKEIRESVL